MKSSTARLDLSLIQYEKEDVLCGHIYTSHNGDTIESHDRKANKDCIALVEKPKRAKNSALKNKHIKDQQFAKKNGNDSSYSIHTNGFGEFSTQTVGIIHLEDSKSSDLWNCEDRSFEAGTYLINQCEGSTWQNHSMESRPNQDTMTIQSSDLADKNGMAILQSDSVQSSSAQPEVKRIVPLKPERSKKIKEKHGVKYPDQSGWIKSGDLLTGCESILEQISKPVEMDSTSAVDKKDVSANGHKGKTRPYNQLPQLEKQLFQDHECQRFGPEYDQLYCEDSSPLSNSPSPSTFLYFDQTAPLYPYIKPQKPKESRPKQSPTTDSGYSLLKTSSLETSKRKPLVTTAWHLFINHRI